MKISIVIPFYNTSKYVERIINSIKSQTYKNYEIICVDDGSTDDTLEVLKKYEGDNIYIFHQENSGPGVARKNGFKKSTGDLIYFMDSDDYLIDDNLFSDINKIFNTNNPDVIMFNTKTIYDDKEVINIPSKSIEKEGLNDISILGNSTISVALMCKVFNRKILREDMFFASNVFEDYYTTYVYLDKCNTFYYINKEMYALYHKEDNNNHLSLTYNPQKYEKTLDIIIKTYKAVTSEEMKKSISFYCQDVIIGYIIKKIKMEIPRKQSKIVKEYIREIVKITKENKTKYEPKSKNKLLKKIIYYCFEIIYS